MESLGPAPKTLPRSSEIPKQKFHEVDLKHRLKFEACGMRRGTRTSCT